MSRATFFAAAALLVAASAPAVTPRLSFVRRIPPLHDLAPARRAAFVYALGDSDAVEVFASEFIDRASADTGVEIDNGLRGGQHLVGPGADAKTLAALKHDHPADVYLGIRPFSCSVTLQESDGSVRNADGERIKVRQHWAEAVCSGRLDALAPDGHRLFSITAKGEGVSGRSEAAVSAEERQYAIEQAARHAAIEGAEILSPRIVRESIELDPAAPSFDDAYVMIDSGRLEAARALWEREAGRHQDSAALHYDLAAVDEALGDVAAARTHYEAARRLAPKEVRYRSGFELFERRSGSAASTLRK